MSGGPAAGGGRWVAVAPERLEGWLTRFAERHGSLAAEARPEAVTAVAADGSRAECAIAFPPLSGEGEELARLVTHSLAPHTYGVLLVRRGGHAAAVVDGVELTASRVGSRPVHGRSAAGGWSQQRFARRREGQTRVAVEAAAGLALHILGPAVNRMECLVTGGDRTLVDTVLGDPRLAGIRALPRGPFLPVPDPGRAVLLAACATAREVRIRLIEADPATA